MSVEKLIEALKAEAATREERIVADAKTEAETILTEARRSAARMTKEREAEATRHEALRQRVAASQATVAARRREQVMQQMALDAVREGVRQRWLAFMASDDYTPYVHRRWGLVTARLGAVGETVADRTTARALGGTSSPAPHIDSAVDDGFVAVSIEGDFEIHERLSVRLDRLWDRCGET